MQRNDSEDGGMVYKFQCDKGFRLKGSNAIHCWQGQWNGSTPSCESKGNTSSSTPWYIFAAISAAALAVVVAVIAAVLCFLQRRRKNRQRDNNDQAASKVGKDTNRDGVDFSGSFNNPAYASSDHK